MNGCPFLNSTTINTNASSSSSGSSSNNNNGGQSLTTATTANATTTRCPAGFGGSSSSAGVCPFAAGGDSGSRTRWSDIARSLPRMPPSLLSGHGSHGLIAVRGIIFDVREEANSPSIKPLLGHDITRCLAKRTPVDDPFLADHLDKGVDGLTFDEVKELEVAMRGFASRYKAIAVLSGGPYASEYIHPSQVSHDGGSSQGGGSFEGDDDPGSMLHHIIQEGGVDDLREYLETLSPSQRSTGLSYTCPRTEMAAIHKAVEKCSLPMVKVLVEHGANLKATAELYDGDTPLQLAQRLKQADIVEYLSAL